MKLAVLIGLLAWMPLLAEDSLPAGAMRVGPNSYVYTDQDGNKKLVRKTPFGLSIHQAPPEGLKPAGERPRELKDNPMLKIEEQGDTLTFRRNTPFGEQVWRRQRSELTPLEQEMIAARHRTLEKEKEAAKSAKPDSPPGAPKSQREERND